MSRNLTAGLITELTAKGLSPVGLFKFEFDSGTLRFWTGIGEITWNSEIYVGSGNLISVSEVSETQELKAKGITFQLSGINASIISIAYTENYQGRPATFWLAAKDSNDAIIADPFISFKGKMDVMEDHDDGETATITLSVESHLIDLERPKVRYYTDEDQQLEYPGDLFFEFVPALIEKEIILESK